MPMIFPARGRRPARIGGDIHAVGLFYTVDCHKFKGRSVSSLAFDFSQKRSMDHGDGSFPFVIAPT